jgi:ABC-type dipeptide/oligopeptide/nickel transport system ATPase component
LLEVEDLVVHFPTDAGLVRAVDGLSFSVHAGETLAVVGESGCGKSVTAMSALQLIPRPPGRYDRGSILFNGVDLL